MNSNKQSFYLIFGTLIVTLIISWVLFFHQAVQADTVDINQFPKTIGTWVSEDLTITKDEFAILETTNAFIRRYTNSVDKAQVYLYIVYSQTNRKVAHPPEVCYSGSGIAIQVNPRDQIKVNYQNMLINSNVLRLNKNEFNQIVYYWFKVGDKFTPSYWQQQILIAFNTMLGKKTSSALIRISSDVVGDSTEQPIKEMKSFTDLITPELFKFLP